MTNKYFDMKDTVYDVIERYKEAKDLLVSLGFTTIEKEVQKKAIAKSINLETALKSKKINPDTFEERLIDLIENNLVEDVTSGVKENKEKSDVKILGVLPCPVKNPLLEELNKWYKNKEDSITIDYELKPASMGVDWLKKDIQNGQSAEDLSDIFMSAGFDLFFDKKLMGKFKKVNVFKDFTGYKEYNKDFNNDYINLKDPDEEYSILGVVPAVFLVNKDELGNRKMPRSWKDILDGDFENSVSLPIGDFDLFNAILLNIYKTYGREGVQNLGRSMKKALHPSQMVKEGGRKADDQPAITIMPYFFTRMAKRFPHMEFVWPEDGAIVSPIFMLTKKEKNDQMQPLIDLMASEKMGKILAEQGLFPSVLPEVDNGLPKDAQFMWPGWDFLRGENPGVLLKDLEAEFNKAVEVVAV